MADNTGNVTRHYASCGHDTEGEPTLCPKCVARLEERIAVLEEPLRLIRNKARAAQRKLDHADQHLPASLIRGMAEGALADIAQEANGALNTDKDWWLPPEVREQARDFIAAFGLCNKHKFQAAGECVSRRCTEAQAALAALEVK